MAQIRIRRDHSFGLTKARKIAWQWAEDVERDFDMECTVVEGDGEDVVEFARTGVSGTLRVTGAVFELDAKLGLLLGAFAATIESKIERNLDDLLAVQGAPAKPAKHGAGKAAPAKTAAKKKPAKG
jgi:putative polyhydroxyalkanoate system protein